MSEVRCREAAVVERRAAAVHLQVGGGDARCALGHWRDAPTHHLDIRAKMEPGYQPIVEKYPKLNHPQRVHHLSRLGSSAV